MKIVSGDDGEIWEPRVVFLFGVAYMHRLLLAEPFGNGDIAARLVAFDGLETREDGDRLRLRAGHGLRASACGR